MAKTVLGRRSRDSFQTAAGKVASGTEHLLHSRLTVAWAQLREPS